MIRYHGTPITSEAAAIRILQGRHGLVSYANPEQIGLVAEVCQSFALDNGAFTHWRQGIEPDWQRFETWIEKWEYHPGFDWFLIPDVIDGSEEDNKKLVNVYMNMNRFPIFKMVPVWHLHESFEWLEYLANTFPRIAIGSSGDFSTPGSDRWEHRMNEVFDLLTDSAGRPQVKIHGLRMMNPTLFSRYPFASVDSANVARNMGIDKQWENNPYMANVSRASRGVVMADRCESHACASVWVRCREKQYGLLFG